MHSRARLVRPVVVLCVSVLAFVAAPRPVMAHHGKSFLLVESDEVPHPGQFFLFTDFALAHHEDEDEIELSPGLLFGVSHRVALEVHTHFHKHEGESLEYESVAPGLKLSLTDPESEEPLKLGLAAEYEIARGEEANRFEGRLIAAYRTRDANLTVNLIGEKSSEEGSELEWGYAAGFRPWPERQVGVGVEAAGTLSGESAHELLAGVYFTGEHLTLRLGVGKGFGEGPEWTARAGVVIQF
jgi:hypothetical protein